MKFKVIIYFLCLSVIPPVHAELKTLTLEECITEACGSNPGVSAARKKIEVADARKGTYLDLPNTGIELTQSTLEGAGMDNGLTFSQEFDFPTVYIARKRVFDAEKDVVREELNENMANLRREVVSIYYSILFYKEKAKYLKENKEFFDEFSRFSNIRFQEGESSRLECLNADRMKSKIEVMIEESDLSLYALQSRLGRILGYDCAVDAAEGNLELIEYKSSAGFDGSGTYSERLFNARMGVSRASISLARQAFIPSFSVSATSQLVIKGFNPYHVERDRFTKGDFMGFSVGVTVPLFFGAKSSELKAARLEEEMLRLQREEERLRQTIEYEDLERELEYSGKRMEYFSKDAVPRAEEMKRLAQISFELGEIDYLEYMQNIEASVEVWIEYLETAERYNQTVVKLKSLTGEI